MLAAVLLLLGLLTLDLVGATPAAALDPPDITYLSEIQGSIDGGTLITIGGTGFSGTTSVDVDGIPALSFTVLSDTEMEFVTPPHPVARVHFHVTTPAGTSAEKFMFTEHIYRGPPVVDSLSVTIGPESGGGTLKIYGSEFLSVNEVEFGPGNPSPDVRVNELDQITVEIPPMPASGPGTVSVIVSHPWGTSTANPPADSYTYLDPPQVSSVVPDTGPTTGGTVVTISG